MPKLPRSPSLQRLRSLDPEIRETETGAIVWRVYFRGGRHPTNWGAFRHVGPVDARFDHHDGSEPTRQSKATMYVADDPVTSLAEVFQRTRVINRWHKEPWLAGFELGCDLRLLDLSGAFATRAGASMALMTGPRSVSRAWVRGFYNAYPDIDGLFYSSSMHSNAPALVFNERAEAAGARPAHPCFHRALGDPAILTLLRNAARRLGYVLN